MEAEQQKQFEEQYRHLQKLINIANQQMNSQSFRLEILDDIVKAKIALDRILNRKNLVEIPT